MKNIVSFETAKRLKEAGFPQPEPEVGQVWVQPNGMAYVITLIRDTEFWGMYMNDIDRIDECDISEIKNDAFCPTATDILVEIPGGLIAFEKYCNIESEFEVWKNGNLLFGSPNPSEAAALAWLEIHEKK